MKSLCRLCAAVVLTLAFTISALAGEIPCGITTPPPPPPGEIHTTAPGEIHTPGEMHTDAPGQIDTGRGGATATLLGLLQTALSLL